MTRDGSPIVAGAAFDGGGRVAVASESGDLYTLGILPDNARGFGDTHIFGEMRDGRGTIHDAWNAPVSLRLSDALAAAQRREEYEVLASQEVSWSGTEVGKLHAVYISPALSAGDRFGFWKTISWVQPCNGASVEVAVKTAETLDEVQEKDWDRYWLETCESSYGYTPGTLTVVKSLDFFNLRGGWLMFKITMETDSLSALPYVSDLAVSYGAKHAVFFFTNKIRIERDEDFGRMVLTASATTPSRTEAVFAVGPGESVDWKDYSPVDLGRLYRVPTALGDRVRVGIRMTSFDETAIPTVHEFALSFEGGDTDNQLNRDES